MTTPPLKTLILAVQNTQDDLLALTWARERLFLVISVFAVILGFWGGGAEAEGVPGMTNRDATVSSPDVSDSSVAVS